MNKSSQDKYLPQALQQFLSSLPEEDFKIDPISVSPSAIMEEEISTGKEVSLQVAADIDDIGREFDFPTMYRIQKMLKTRTSNGQIPLKRLTNRHLKIIGLYLNGYGYKTIAIEVGCSYATVARVVNDPLASTIIEGCLEDTKGEIRALMPRAVTAVRAGLSSDRLDTRFRAIDKLKVISDMTEASEKSETAEDIVQKLLKGAGIQINVGNNVQVNNGSAS